MSDLDPEQHLLEVLVRDMEQNRAGLDRVIRILRESGEGVEEFLALRPGDLEELSSDSSVALRSRLAYLATFTVYRRADAEPASVR